MSPPLIIYVDLDETLVKTDTLFESIFCLANKKPFFLLLVPIWLIQKGKAYMKAQISTHGGVPEPSLLPYNRDLLDFLKAKKREGHRLVLSTAADSKVAGAVEDYLQIFDRVLASDGNRNLKGIEKISAIKLDCGGCDFAYAGDSSADLVIWREATEAIVVGSHRGIEKKLQQSGVKISKVFPETDSIMELFKAIRPHQWAKNLLVFVSLVLSHQVLNSALVLVAILAFFAFSLCASGVYLCNDLLDLEADRRHKQKCFRPLAAGKITFGNALFSITLFLVVSAMIASLLPIGFQLTLAVYFVATLAYSLWLKRVVLLDVVFLSLLYTVRIIAGSLAIQVTTTPWLMGFSIFIFLSLAFVKRYSELHGLKVAAEQDFAHGRGYHVEDIDQLAIFGVVSGYISVLVLALYINSPQLGQFYGDINYLWLMCPLLIYWISRIWLLARRGEIHEDPVVFTLHDKVSYLVGGGAAVLLIMAI